MRKLLPLLYLLVSLQAFGQERSYNLSTETDAVSNFEAKYRFQRVGVYDEDLKEWRTDHPPYEAATTVVVKIGADGEGKIFISQYGHEKLTYEVITSRKVKTGFRFNWMSGLGQPGHILLTTRDGKVSQLQIYTDTDVNDNMVLVYF